jgi:uncharacterized Zn finger protein
MKFQCPHCRSNAFRLLTDAGGESQAECLDCGRVSPFTVSAMLAASRPKRPAGAIPRRPAGGNGKAAD